MTITRALCLIAVFILLSGCIIQPIPQDQSLVLEKGYGLVAIQMLTDEQQPQVLFDPADGKGAQLEISGVPAGNSLYVLQAPAGRYCMSEYFYLRQRINPHGMGCFSVTEGHLVFSGYLSPQVVDGKVFVEQAIREDDAEADLKRQYPLIASQHLETPASDLLVTSWLERTHGYKSEIYFHNSMPVPSLIKTLGLFKCQNVKQECKVYDVNVLLAPHETKVLMEVEAADHAAAFWYGYEFNRP